MEFLRQKYWSGLSFPHPDPGITRNGRALEKAKCWQEGFTKLQVFDVAAEDNFSIHHELHHIPVFYLLQEDLVSIFSQHSWKRWRRMWVPWGQMDLTCRCLHGCPQLACSPAVHGRNSTSLVGAHLVQPDMPSALLGSAARDLRNFGLGCDLCQSHMLSENMSFL